MSTIVKLSDETRALLAVAASINNSIKIEAGSMIKTMHPNRGLVMEAAIEETFPEEFCIYELNRLLSVLKLANMKDAELIFNNTNYMEIRSGKVSVKYCYTDQQFIAHPGKTISIPSSNLNIKLTSQEISDVMKLAATLGHKVIEFKAVGGKVFMSATTPEVSDTSNDTVFELPDDPTAKDGSYKIKIDNLVFPTDDYNISICDLGISHWVAVNRKVNVYIGIEKA